MDVSTEGICSGVAGPTNAGSVERSNSVLAPDLACPDGRLPDDEASARFGAVTGGPLVSANAGDGGRPI